MLWIEGKRLEMGIDTALQDASTQLHLLKTRRQWKDLKALREEFREWMHGDTDPEDQAWLDYHEWWGGPDQ